MSFVFTSFVSSWRRNELVSISSYDENSLCRNHYSTTKFQKRDDLDLDQKILLSE